MRNYGFKIPVEDPEAYIFGGGNIPEENLQPDGDWRNFLVKPELQNINDVETFGCTGFGLSTQVEIYTKRKFLKEINISDRGLNIMAGTTLGGNDPQTMYETFRKNGAFPEEFLPFENIKTFQEYYSPKPLPDRLVEEAKKYLYQYQFWHEWVEKPGKVIPHQTLKNVLMHSPIAIGTHSWVKDLNGLYTKAGEENHWTVLVAFEGDLPVVFDSYEDENNTIKVLEPEYEIRYAKRIYVEAVQSSESWIVSILKRLFS